MGTGPNQDSRLCFLDNFKESGLPFFPIILLTDESLVDLIANLVTQRRLDQAMFIDQIESLADLFL